MKPYHDIYRLLSWAEANEDDPLYLIADKWMLGEKASNDMLIKGLVRIAEITQSEVYQYKKFELTQIRSQLMQSLNNVDIIKHDLATTSLNKPKKLDRVDAVYLSISVVMCSVSCWLMSYMMM